LIDDAEAMCSIVFSGEGSVKEKVFAWWEGEQVC